MSPRDLTRNILDLDSHPLKTVDGAFSMAAEVVYSSTNGANALQGQLFDGMKFWLSAKVPQRSRFINDLKVFARVHHAVGVSLISDLA